MKVTIEHRLRMKQADTLVDALRQGAASPTASGGSPTTGSGPIKVSGTLLGPDHAAGTDPHHVRTG